MKRTVALAASLSLLWLLLSGYWHDPLLLGFGLLSVGAVVALSLRMGIVDAEGVPLRQIPGLLTYLPWLAWQVVLSAMTVARIVLSPKLSISPTLAAIPAAPKTAIGQVIFANSITLTPGTLSLDLDDGAVLVHGLRAAGIDDLMTGEMGRRVAALDGRGAP
ncbi:cation transporter [Rhodospirillum rubrum]|uniref:Na+/H+ antiporter subunit E n=1 Tax=Rhodospirillum rubrum TaxID=1085 RepID=UPI001902F781|nr:Na+/H+ antiporter subunit E [Rhodospirillum rubrum]MBK1664321.1 cation transporter [Rhodospirillum rubrum]MBK1676766.1 cation transporter [Rhodospirillum rubrum]